MYILARIYENEGHATAAATALVDAGYSSDVVAMLSAPAAPSPAPMHQHQGHEGQEDGVAAAPADTTPPPDLLATGVKIGRMLGEHSDFYLSRLTVGRTLVVATPHFLESRPAEIILDDHNPLPDTHRKTYAPYVPVSEKATPLSDWLGLPTLANGTLSEALGFGFKQDGVSHLSRWFPPLKSDWTFSSVLGMKTQSSSATPFSSMLGLPTKSSRLEGKNSSFGISLRSNGTFFPLPTKSKRDHFLY